MIRAKEVRINNIIQDREGRVLRVEKIDDTEDEGYEISAWPIGGGGQVGYPFKPLPLTEEWLVKFGLKLVKKDKAMCGEVARTDDFLSKENAFYYVFNSVETQMGDWYHVSKQIHYVHELQNIYFTHNDEELIIK
jgi:hypothetical protein